ncbi:NAD(P)-dependent oxidoreductase [Rhodococcus opacus]|uniref:Hydroxyacid dehydrogenase n=1 Tax=Rhodococcus opacus TaxID=37919 RepID=A0A2S8J1J1_RHOOP|nr:NAD(P)-dependent oxidoreductase [Rhodococcus opacus]PQP20835.1 hydroxyacid dehydrogenase [Rhodococcus opacus]
MPTFYVSEQIHSDAVAELSRMGQVHLGYGDVAVAYTDIADTVDAVLLRAEIFDADKIRNSRNLKIIARHGVGTDNVDIDVATAASVWVTTTPGSNSRAVAEHVFALLLSLARKTPAAAAGTAAGEWAALKPHLTGFELGGRVLGLLGFGNIAVTVSEIARGFGMRVLVADPYVADTDIEARGCVPVTLDQLITDADIISLHLPLTVDTRNLFDAPTIARMRPGAILLNTARGGLVDEQALLDALDDGRLGGAGLDVLDGESDDPKTPLAHSLRIAEYLAANDNLIVTPHVGGQTEESLRNAGSGAVQCIRQALAGDTPDNAVNSITPAQPLTVG